VAYRNISPDQFALFDASTYAGKTPQHRAPGEQGTLFDDNPSALGNHLGFDRRGNLEDSRRKATDQFREPAKQSLASDRKLLGTQDGPVPDINNPQYGDAPRKNYSFIPGQRVMPEPSSHHAESHGDEWDDAYEDEHGNTDWWGRRGESALEINHEGNVYQANRLNRIGAEAESNYPHESQSYESSDGYGYDSDSDGFESGGSQSGSHHPWSDSVPSTPEPRGSSGNPFADWGPQFSKHNQALWDKHAEHKQISTSAVLHTGQGELRNPDHDHIVGPMNPESTTKILLHKGVPWILDGHHRLMEARGRGLSTFHASVLNTDQIPQEEVAKRGYE
jgi:hypothetical protein